MLWNKEDSYQPEKSWDKFLGSARSGAIVRRMPLGSFRNYCTYFGRYTALDYDIVRYFAERRILAPRVLVAPSSFGMHPLDLRMMFALAAKRGIPSTRAVSVFGVDIDKGVTRIARGNKFDPTYVWFPHQMFNDFVRCDRKSGFVSINDQLHRDVRFEDPVRLSAYTPSDQGGFDVSLCLKLAIHLENRELEATIGRLCALTSRLVVMDCGKTQKGFIDAVFAKGGFVPAEGEILNVFPSVGARGVGVDADVGIYVPKMRKTSRILKL